ncbi:CaiB/BaiF CoA-transferase family protein [Variovorax sp. YR216]|uniref:CaiB/BaiF CoA transferase family protein n=1 Tax=Variovorax sp. YR216 TaxID=1882828 RepID=UPI000899802F|nr:CaiB/BaiF CoA-transferase family protein [Variovorax sp. YR216]SEB18739.1 Crotonobetainyl-CoA:carnitine CoA-transferase CaiB [Variovorax sp. YR216]
MSVFNGLRVLDVASFIAGPAAATILADFGADVIKIEVPEGDGFRKTVLNPNLAYSEHNYLWMQGARSRRAIALDLKKPEGQAVLHRLVREADVLITNYPLPVRARLGLAWETIRELNPRLVYASLTGYGETGPEAGKPGFDATTYWARSGLADLTRPDPEGPPANPANGLGDQPTAVTLFAAIVTGLYARERTGRGGMVSTSLLANGAWANAMAIQGMLVGGRLVYRQPRSQPRNALTNFYRCRDGRWFILSLVTEERDWEAFLRAIERPALAQDPRFAATPARRENAPTLAALLDDVFQARDSAEWTSRFGDEGLTVGVVARSGDALGDEQMRLCGALVPGEGIPGTGLTVSSPFLVEGADKTYPRHAPGIGEHTDEVLSEAGYAEDEIARLRTGGAVK